MKSVNFVVYENSSHEFDIVKQWKMKVRVTTLVHSFSPFTAMQTVKFYYSFFGTHQYSNMYIMWSSSDMYTQIMKKKTIILLEYYKLLERISYS